MRLGVNYPGAKSSRDFSCSGSGGGGGIGGGNGGGIGGGNGGSGGPTPPSRAQAPLSRVDAAGYTPVWAQDAKGAAKTRTALRTAGLTPWRAPVRGVRALKMYSPHQAPMIQVCISPRPPPSLTVGRLRRGKLRDTQLGVGSLLPRAASAGTLPTSSRGQRATCNGPTSPGRPRPMTSPGRPHAMTSPGPLSVSPGRGPSDGSSGGPSREGRSSPGRNGAANSSPGRATHGVDRAMPRQCTPGQSSAANEPVSTPGRSTGHSTPGRSAAQGSSRSSSRTRSPVLHQTKNSPRRGGQNAWAQPPPTYTGTIAALR